MGDANLSLGVTEVETTRAEVLSPDPALNIARS
jgi:hypothetical protein